MAIMNNFPASEVAGYVIGTYTGTGIGGWEAGWNVINLGFRPKAVVITSLNVKNSDVGFPVALLIDGGYLHVGDTLGNDVENWVGGINDDGFFVGTQGLNQQLNHVDAKYAYIAFK